MQGGLARFEGSGKLNGNTNARFRLTTAVGGTATSAAGRFALEIWHTDPASGADVVDYDNRRAGPGNIGSAVEGRIVQEPR